MPLSEEKHKEGGSTLSCAHSNSFAKDVHSIVANRLQPQTSICVY